MEKEVNIRILLLSLYEYKYNGKLYELGEIFARTSMQINPPEIERVATALARNGLIKTISVGNTIYGQITVDGVEFVEEHSFFSGSSYLPKDMIKPLDREMLRHNIAELNLRLQNSTLGVRVEPDVLAHEIQEVSALLNILGRRNWLQLLKGKLLELSKGQLDAQALDQLMEIIETKHSAETPLHT